MPKKIDGQTCQDNVRHFDEIYDTAAITDLDRCVSQSGSCRRNPTHPKKLPIAIVIVEDAPLTAPSGKRISRAGAPPPRHGTTRKNRALHAEIAKTRNAGRFVPRCNGHRGTDWNLLFWGGGLRDCRLCRLTCLTG